MKLKEWEGHDVTSDVKLEFVHDGNIYYLGGRYRRYFFRGIRCNVTELFSYDDEDLPLHKNIFFKSVEVKQAVRIEKLLTDLEIDHSIQDGEIVVDDDCVTSIEDIVRLINLQNTSIQNGDKGGPIKKQGYSCFILKGTNGKYYKAQVSLVSPSAEEWRQTHKIGNIPYRWTIDINELKGVVFLYNNSRMFFPNK